MMGLERIVILVFLILLMPVAQAGDLRPFSSDGCSNFPDGTFEDNKLWLGCCTAHDMSYWQGGSYQQRLAADQVLRSCVEQAGEPEIALLMLAGVRVGGTPYLPTRFRWGYGWPYPKFYTELTAEELVQINSLIRQ